MHMYIYTQVYVHTYACIYIHVYILHVFICICINMCTLCICIDICSDVYECVFMNISTYTYMFTGMCIHVGLCIYTCVYVNGMCASKCVCLGESTQNHQIWVLGGIHLHGQWERPRSRKED